VAACKFYGGKILTGVFYMKGEKCQVCLAFKHTADIAGCAVCVNLLSYYANTAEQIVGKGVRDGNTVVVYGTWSGA